MRNIALPAAVLAAGLVLASCGSGEDDLFADEPTSPATTSSGSSSATKSADSSSGSSTTESALERLKKDKKIKVGTKFDQPGFGLKGLKGSPEGFDVEVAKIITKELGIDEKNIEWVEAPSKFREELLENGKADMVVATYTINDKRKERITFAGPYYEAGQQIMVKKDNNKINGPKDLKANADQKVCSVMGSTPAEQIKEYLAKDDQLVLFDVYDKCVDALKTGQVQAVTTDNVILLGYVSKSKGAYKLVGEQFTKEPYGIGVKKGDTKFCEFINTTLKAKEADYSKAWKATAGKFEGAADAKLPAADPCK